MPSLHNRLKRLMISGFVTLAAVFFALTPSQVAARDSLTVFAAASLKHAIDDINVAYMAATGKQVIAVYAGSSALARQIEAGAPADLFISADLAWMTYLDERGLVDRASKVDLVGNRLALVRARDFSTGLVIGPGFALDAALGEERLAIANVDAVPAGRYGKAALISLGVWDAVKGKMAQTENVRAALRLVSLGEAPLGIVYRSDAKVDRNVSVVGLFPADTHSPIIYPAARLRASSHRDALVYLAFLQSDEALAIFRRYGFETRLPRHAARHADRHLARHVARHAN